MKPIHQSFAKFSLFLKPKEAMLKAFKEAGRENFYASHYSYELLRQCHIQAYREEFMRRLRPFIEMVFEEMKDFKPQK